MASVLAAFETGVNAEMRQLAPGAPPPAGPTKGYGLLKKALYALPGVAAFMQKRKPAFKGK